MEMDYRYLTHPYGLHVTLKMNTFLITKKIGSLEKIIEIRGKTLEVQKFKQGNEFDLYVAQFDAYLGLFW